MSFPASPLRHLVVPFAFAFALTAASPARAAVQSAAQVKCAAAVTKSATKVVRAKLKDHQGCLKSAALAADNGCPDAEACLAADLSGKVADAIKKMRETGVALCAEAPGFGQRPMPLIETSVHGETLGLLDDVFGADRDAAVVTKAADSAGAACQSKVAGRAAKLMLAMSAAYDACKGAGLDDGSIADSAGLAGCLAAIDADAKGKIAAARRSLDATVSGSCGEGNIASLLPGSCATAPAFADCVQIAARCRACRRGAIGDDTGADCDLFDDAVANASCTGFAGRCNGRAELCGRTFDAVAYPTTHNAMSNAEENWPMPNQALGLSRQLSDGIRSMMLDTHEFNGEVVLCHAICDLGETAGYKPREPFTDGLDRIHEYLEVNPGAVLSIIFESYITEAQTLQAFADSGLTGFLHEQVPGEPWPTLEQLVASGKRLVVFTDDSSASLPWHHYVWDHAWETHYSFETVEDFSCAINRGTFGNPLFILNHFLTQSFGSATLASQANRDPLFPDRAEQCQLEGGQLPNFVTVDFYNKGVLFQVTDMLNGIERCGAL